MPGEPSFEPSAPQDRRVADAMLALVRLLARMAARDASMLAIPQLERADEREQGTEDRTR
jgi:hypothetical protein